MTELTKSERRLIAVLEGEASQVGAMSSEDYRRIYGQTAGDRSEMSATEYRSLHPFPPTRRFRTADETHSIQPEMTAAEYRQRYGASDDLMPQRVTVNTETPAKTEFAAWLDATSPYPVLREHCGIPGRKFRFDWFIQELALAFEYDGVADHGTRKGSERDAEKGNLAQLHEILFIRVNARSLRDGTGYTMSEDAFALRGVAP